jgi:hypothetical protein
MGSPPYIQPGQNLSGIPAASWNAFVDATRRVAQLNQITSGTGASDGAQRLTCLVKNTTGSLIDEPFPVLEMVKPIYTTDDTEDVIRRGITLDGYTPGVGVGINQVCIVQGPIPDDGIREAVVIGPTWVRLNVIDEEHTHAIPKDNDHTQLSSSDGSTGGVPIVWKEVGTGTKWAFVILGECCGGGGGESGDCTVTVGCGLDIVGTPPNLTLQVNAADLAGGGLVDSGDCTLDVAIGDGLEFAGGGEIQNKLARGLMFTSINREIETEISCGLEFSGNAIRVKRADLIGLGLEGDTGTCNLRLKLNPTSSCLILDANGLRVDAACLAGDMITPGCGLDFDAGDLVVVAADLAGSGLTTEGTCGLAVNPGCGLEISGDTVRVKRSDLIGNGLENGPGTCNLQLKLGSCLVFDGSGAVAVDGTCLVGDTITPGCGLEFSGGDLRVKASDVAGTGLVTEGTCGIAVNPGCGLETSGDTVRVKRADLLGLGLEADSGTCNLKIKLATSSCLILDANGLKVDAACLVGSAITPGCGLEFFGGDLRVKASDLAGNGLTTTGTCGLQVNVGCGIQITSDAVAFKPSDVAGLGLVAGTGCTLDVNPGCGLEIVSNAVRVKRSDLVGLGLEADSGTCNLKLKLGSCLQFDVNGAVAVDSACLVGDTITPGCGLEFAAGALRVKNTDLAGNGLGVTGTCGLQVNVGCGLEISSDTVRVKVADLLGQGLTTSGTCGLMLNLGCGLEFDGAAVRVDNAALVTGTGGLVAAGTCAVSVNPGCGIEIVANAVRVKAIDLTGPGLSTNGTCGLQVVAGCGIAVGASVSVDAAQLAGVGLTTSGGCTLNVNPGCGLQITGDTVAVKASDLASATSGLVTEGTCGIKVNVGCGIEIASNAVRVKAIDLTGPGLSTNGTCGLQVVGGCGITVGASVSVNAADIAGAGLTGTGCTLNVIAGCGITVAADSVSVNHTALAGSGLIAGTGCQLDVNVGCGLEIVTDAVRVKASDLAGSGLVAEGTCGLAVNPGCGIQIVSDQVRVDATAIAGPGLSAVGGSSCAVQVNVGCGLTNSADQISINRPALLGQGLEAGAGTCDIKVKLGSCLVFDVNNAVAVNPSCIGAALTPGCGISIAGSTVSVINTALAGSGLIAGTGCSIDINAGCGLEIVSDQLRVRPTDLAGIGLVAAASGCGLDVDLGCGLTLDGITGAIKVDAVDLTGPGLSTSGTCGLQVVGGCGITVGASVSVNASQIAGAGLTGSGCTLNVIGGCGITVGADAVSVNHTALAGSGLVAGVNCQLDVNVGCGLEIVTDAVRVKASDLAGSGLIAEGTCGLAVNPGCGLEILSDQVRVKAADIAGPGLTPVGGSSCGIQVNVGCGLTNSSDAISVNHTALAGNGLLAGINCQLDVNVGCGLEIVTDQVRVKAADLAGSGLVAEGTCGLAVNPGCGLEIASDQVRVKASDLAGAGLTPVGGSSCGLQVNVGCGLVNSSDAISVNRTALIGKGLEADTGTCNLKVKIGNCLQFDVNNAIAVDAACLGGALTPGCGISIVGSTISVSNGALAGSGLTTEGTCGLRVNTGCGLEIAGGAVKVKPADLVGINSSSGLIVSGTTCGIAVDRATASEFTFNSLNSFTCNINPTTNQLELRFNVTPWLLRRNAALMPVLLSPGSPQIIPCNVPLTVCS